VGCNLKVMQKQTSPRRPRWYAIPARVLFVTFLLTLLSFAVSLLISIVGLLVVAKFQGATPDMRFAYRGVALPAAAITGAIVLFLSSALEIRHYRQTKALAGIARASR
jgi:hypothetical protein